MESSCYFVFSHSVLVCPDLYSTNLHNSLRTCSIPARVLSTQPSWTAFSVFLEPLIILRRGPHRKHLWDIRLRLYWSVTSIGHGADDIESPTSSIVACWTLFTEPLPGNVQIKSVTTYNIYNIWKKKTTCKIYHNTESPKSQFNLKCILIITQLCELCIEHGRSQFEHSI
jgi:hypothetical protein